MTAIIIDDTNVVGLVALAVSLDGNGIKFGLGNDSNLGVEVDAKINVTKKRPRIPGMRLSHPSDQVGRPWISDEKLGTYSPVITTSGD